jgi:hypothetical protein
MLRTLPKYKWSNRGSANLQGASLRGSPIKLHRDVKFLEAVRLLSQEPILCGKQKTRKALEHGVDSMAKSAMLHRTSSLPRSCRSPLLIQYCVTKMQACIIQGLERENARSRRQCRSTETRKGASPQSSAIYGSGIHHVCGALNMPKGSLCIELTSSH